LRQRLRLRDQSARYRRRKLASGGASRRSETGTRQLEKPLCEVGSA
jgi:hypothetical protein